MLSRLLTAILLVFACSLSLHARELPQGVAWLWEFEAPLTVPPVVSDSGTVLVVTGSKAYGIRLRDGARLWESELPAAWESFQAPLLVGQTAVLPATNGRLLALDLATGVQKWSMDATRSASQLCVGRLLVLQSGRLQALDPLTGEVRWRLAGDGYQELAVHGRRVFYATGEELGVYDLGSGRSLWRQPGRETESLVLDAAVALAVGQDLVARDPASGRRLWRLPDCDRYWLVGDLVISSDYSEMVALARRSGRKVWSADHYALEVSEAGPRYLASSDGYRTSLLDRQNGRQVRQLETHFPPLFHGGQLLAAGRRGELYRIDGSGRLAPGLRNVWGQAAESALGLRGTTAGGLRLLPAGSALVALGDGPGAAHLAGQPHLKLTADTPVTPGKVEVGTSARFVRRLTLSAYRLPATLPTPESPPAAPPAASLSWQIPAGSSATWNWRSLPLKEPGTYLLELKSGSARDLKRITVTNFGLTVKLAPRDLLVQTLDIVRRTPLAGVAIEVAGKTGRLLEGTTDAQGVARWQGAGLEETVRLHLRGAGEELLYEFSPEPTPSTEKVSLQTDRPLYRPGHVIHFKGLAADGERSQPLRGRTVHLEVRDSADNPLLERNFVTDSWGTFSGSLTLPGKPPLGRYRISARLGEKADPFHLPFEVQEYRKPPFEVSLTPRTPLVRAGEPLVFDLQASYYFGGPVPNGKVLATVRRAELSGRPTPGSPGQQYYADFYSESSLTTGPDGRAVLTVATAPGTEDSEYLLDVEVTGPSGQVVQSSTSGLASPSRYGVYLDQESWMASAGRPVTVTVLTLDRLARPQTGTVILQVKGQEGFQVQGKLQTGADGKARFSWTPPRGGYYSVTALSPEGGEGAGLRPAPQVSYWANGDGASPAAERKLVAEKTEVAPGQTARLLLQVKQPGPALLTIEGDQLHSSRSFSTRAGAQLLELPILADYAPGVTISVETLEGAAMVSNSVKLSVPDTAHRLDVKLRADKPEYRPGESARIRLTVTDPQGQPVDADASLALVDESLFALSPDQVPSLHSTFFGPRANRVQTFKMAPRRNEVAGFQTVPAPTRVRQSFKDTAHWQPNVLVSGGEAEVLLPLPDNLTRWRATSRASTAGLQVGQGTTTLVSNLPLMAQAILPRFLIEGDAVDLLALVTNRTKEPVDVKVELSATPGQLEAEQAELPGLRPDGQGRAVSRLKVEENVLGKAPLPSRLEVQVEARSESGESDAERISIPILPFGAPFAEGGSSLLKAGESKEARLRTPSTLLHPRLEVRVAGSPLGVVEGALDYLADFPYGCVEQTMSRFLPTVIAARAMGELGLFSPEQQKRLGPMVEQGLAALYSYQHSDGGWGWWEDDATHPYMTGYVISGLETARRAGYTVSPAVLERGISAASYELRQLEPGDTDTRVYLAWALAVAGKPPLETMKQLTATPSAQLSTYSTALLALAWQTTDEAARALPLLDELERRAVTVAGGVSWPSKALRPYGWTDDDVETTSLALRALLAARPDSKVAREAVPWLLAQRREGQWKSTRDTAQAVLALLDFADQEQASGTGDGLLEIGWDGQTLSAVPLADQEAVLSVPAEKLGAGEHRLSFTSSGRGAIYSYSLTGFLREKERVDLAAESSGLRLARTYVLEQPGQLLRFNRVTPPEILNLASGQEVEVELELELPAGMEYLQLEDPRPAGFEVIEGSLSGQKPDRVEHRDAFSAFFFTSLAKGKHLLSYRLRAEAPGEYRALPAQLKLMYRPDVYGSSPSQRVRVRREGEAR